MDENPYQSPSAPDDVPPSNWRRIAFWSLLVFGSIFTLAAAIGIFCEIVLVFLRMRDPENELIRFKLDRSMSGLVCLALGMPMLWGASRLSRKKSQD
jgi:hypothetical protein